jgi:tetratricopeptide (TPR) repeat protein
MAAGVHSAARVGPQSAAVTARPGKACPAASAKTRRRRPRRPRAGEIEPQENNKRMPGVALSMIVRNEAATLRRCLESVRGVVQELLIADTGSSDGTPDLARECGARVIEIPWESDFAAARNRALEGLQSPWVLSLDADEVLDPAAGPVIAQLAAGDGVAGYQVTIRNYVGSLEERLWDRPARPNDSGWLPAQAYPAYVEHENVRFFRRDPRVRFSGRVHESVGPSIERAGLRLGPAAFRIHHFGLAADQPTRARKNALYRELGRQKVQEMPGSAQAHLELGLVELDNFGRVAEALVCFERACQLNPRLGVAWFFAGVAHLRQEQHREALHCLRRAQQAGHATPALAEALGDAHYNRGEFAAAAQAYGRALRKTPQAAELAGKHGLARARAGEIEEGLAELLAALRARPDSGPLHDRLILLLAWLERIPEAARAAEEKLRRVPGTASADFLRAARLWMRQGDWARATAVLHVGRQLHPGAAPLEQALADLAARHGAGVDQLVTTLQNAGTRGARD